MMKPWQPLGSLRGSSVTIYSHPSGGGMGEIFLARFTGEHGVSKRVAVKRIKPELSSSPDFVDRFISEARIVVPLSHANLVQVFDLGRSGEALFLAMEYVEGADLGRLMKACPEPRRVHPIELGVFIATEALKGLAYAHEHDDEGHPRGVLHLDISPANLLISYSGEVKITDFGVAQALSMAQHHQPGDAIVGKYAYMAPEMIRGEKLDERTDLYSLAVVLYELLAGRRAFAASAPDESILTSVLEGRVAPLASVRPELPPRLVELVERALSREMRTRPRHARVMLTELAALAQRLRPITAPEVGQWVRRSAPPLSTGATESRTRPRQHARPWPRRPDRIRAGGTRAAAGGASVATFLSRRTQTASASGNPRRALPRPRRARGGFRSSARSGSRSPRRCCSSGPRRGPRCRKCARPCARDALDPYADRHAEPRPAPFVSALRARCPRARPCPQADQARAPRAPPHPRLTLDGRSVRAARANRFLNINAEPWAYVRIDGKKMGATPLARLPLEEGAHLLRLERAGLVSIERTVHVVAGQAQVVDLDLRSEKGP